MPETTEPLTEAQVDEIESRLNSIDRQPLTVAAGIFLDRAVPALIRDWRAMKARLAACEGSRRVHELDNHHNALGCGYCAGPIKEESTRLTTENAALREQLAQAGEREQILQEQVTRLAALAETRSDIIAAKAAHVDDLESRLAQAIRDRDEARKQRRELSGDMLGGP